jgi:hypothetical protein
LITDDERVSALVHPYRGDRQAFVMLDLALLFRAVLVAQLSTFCEQLLATLNALHKQHQPFDVLRKSGHHTICDDHVGMVSG